MIKYILMILLLPSIVFAQGLYTYPKTSGESVVFGWDYVQIQITCGTQIITLPRGQATYTCNGVTYPLIWTGENLRIVGAKAGGADLLISQRYNFQALKTNVTPEVIAVQGETAANQIGIPLSFGEGTFRMKVRIIRTWDGTDRASEFALSDGPNGVVNGVARPWVIQINPQTCTSFTYSAWTPAVCPSNGIQTRTVLTSLPTGCAGGTPVLSQTCTYVPPVVACTSFTYSAWSPCPIDGIQTRTVLTSLPSGCVGGVAPVLNQTCTYVPPDVVWPGGLKVLP